MKGLANAAHYMLNEDDPVTYGYYREEKIGKLQAEHIIVPNMYEEM
jgi:hypothetical protein